MARLSRNRRWFGRGRDVASRDIDVGEAEILAFTVRRIWDLNECGPGCCPRTWLVETSTNEFIHLESWTALPELASILSNCEAHRTIHGHTLLAFSTSGPPVRVEATSVRDALLDFSDGECEYVAREALPEEFWQVVSQV